MERERLFHKKLMVKYELYNWQSFPKATQAHFLQHRLSDGHINEEFSSALLHSSLGSKELCLQTGFKGKKHIVMKKKHKNNENFIRSIVSARDSGSEFEWI